MGYSDLDEDVELPSEAGDFGGSKFVPDETWLEHASEEYQIEAMRLWFIDRYEDPTNSTPYSEGEFVYIWGGPFDPNDVIQEKFGHIVEYEVIRELVERLYLDVGYDWAPVDHDHDYDEELSLEIINRSDPWNMLTNRLDQIKAILALTGNKQTIQLTIQLAYGATITAMEAYLWDTVAYWTENDDDTLKAFVSTNKDFQAKTLQLSTIFDRMENLNIEVETYLQQLVWHRLDKVKPIMENGLNISVPDINLLMKEVLLRHDIVHRGGRTKVGDAISLHEYDVNRIIDMVYAFASGIEDELDKRYPEIDIPF